MRALLCKVHGLPESLVIEEVPAAVAGPGQVVVRIEAAGVNFPDALIIQNKYQLKPALPFIPGAEMAGIVTALGPGVTRFRVGDAVCGVVSVGAFAEEIAVDAGKLVALPTGAPLDIASAFILAYGTSHHALTDRASLTAGQTLLVLGASGGVGLAAVEIGKLIGARVIACASSAAKLAVCVRHGADATIDYSTENLRERVKALTNGNGADVIYDPVGGEYAEPALRSIAWRGRYLVVGFANGEIPKIPLNLALLKGCSIVGVFWGGFVGHEPQTAVAAITELFQWLAAGKLKPEISARYALADAPKALRAMMDRKVTGKIVILPQA
ncbi:MAG: NADPH:quinone oxidoreductase family protein [Betaproteobacteria bacterium]